MKTTLDFIHAYSVRDLLAQVNDYNMSNPETPITKEDIVGITNNEDSMFLLYFK